MKNFQSVKTELREYRLTTGMFNVDNILQLQICFEWNFIASDMTNVIVKYQFLTFNSIDSRHDFFFCNLFTKLTHYRSLLFYEILSLSLAIFRVFFYCHSNVGLTYWVLIHFRPSARHSYLLMVVSSFHTKFWYAGTVRKQSKNTVDEIYYRIGKIYFYDRGCSGWIIIWKNQINLTFFLLLHMKTTYSHKVVVGVRWSYLHFMPNKIKIKPRLSMEGRNFFYRS